MITSAISERRLWLLLLGFCLGSRLLSAVYYIEDTDSLRFALSMIEYNVAKLQPHFPAYPVFCWTAKMIYGLTGRFAVAFSLLGGLSTFFIIYFLSKVGEVPITAPLGLCIAFLVFFNPLLWLMGNRYMPDLLGVGCLLASFYYLTVGQPTRVVGLGFFLAGILLGVRLSYAPFLLMPLLLVLLRPGPRLGYMVAGLVGTAIWLVPLIVVTGWDTLVAAALTQSQGHFSDFGGTVATQPDLGLRVERLIESVWADGFGFYWTGRSWVTLGSTLALLGIVVYHGRSLVRYVDRRVFLSAAFMGCVVYLLWIFFYQNVVYKSRHILPLLPFFILVIAYACSCIVSKGRRFDRMVLGVFAVCYAYVGVHLVIQHKAPTAIAQIHHYLSDRQSDKLHIVSVPLIKYYLVSQGIKAVYLTVEERADLQALDGLDAAADLVSIDAALAGRPAKVTTTFYHNPYVNQMWPALTIYEY